MSKAGAGWRAAYRLQLRPGFDFDDAAAVVPYLADLGVSHLYLSPIVEAARGSEHGYDVVDHGRIRGELGGREGFDRLVGAAHDHGLGILLDIVPNHMAVSGPDSMNRWWWDVLKHGPASRYADWFDIAWDDMPGHRVLLPLLDDHLARVLDAGRIRVVRDDHGFEARFEDHRFPIDPTTVVDIIGAAAAVAGDTVLAVLADALRTAAPDRPADAARAELAVRRHLAATPRRRRRGRRRTAGASLESRSDRAPPRPPALAAGALADRRTARSATAASSTSPSWPHCALTPARCSTRCTSSRSASPVVGRSTGYVSIIPTACAIPRAYLGRLAERLPDTPLWVEKILGPDEPLRSAWPVEGTTGYDFLNLVTELFVDSAGAAALHRSGSRPRPATAHVRRGSRRGKRLEALDGLLSADLDRVDRHRSPRLRAPAAGTRSRRANCAACSPSWPPRSPYYRTYVRAGHLAGRARPRG